MNLKQTRDTLDVCMHLITELENALDICLITYGFFTLSKK